jgi:hypothetical protein
VRQADMQLCSINGDELELELEVEV